MPLTRRGQHFVRHAARVDANQREIVEELREAGVRILLINQAVDAVCLYRGQVLIVDFKTVEGRLTDTQRELVMDGWPITFARSAFDVLKALGAVE